MYDELQALVCNAAAQDDLASLESLLEEGGKAASKLSLFFETITAETWMKSP